MAPLGVVIVVVVVVVAVVVVLFFRARPSCEALRVTRGRARALAPLGGLLLLVRCLLLLLRGRL